VSRFVLIKITIFDFEFHTFLYQTVQASRLFYQKKPAWAKRGRVAVHSVSFTR